MKDMTKSIISIRAKSRKTVEKNSEQSNENMIMQFIEICLFL
jgi:hypothetical protein